LHGALSFDFERDNSLRPIFQLSKFSRSNEFLTTPLEAYDNITSVKAGGQYSPWKEKKIDKLFWRGSSTGDSFSKRGDYDWRNSHRVRLNMMTNLRGREEEILAHRGDSWKKERWDISELNDRYMDVGFTGQPHQVSRAERLREV
jgi:hypothetical protein